MTCTVKRLTGLRVYGMVVNGRLVGHTIIADDRTKLDDLLQDTALCETNQYVLTELANTFLHAFCYFLAHKSKASLVHILRSQATVKGVVNRTFGLDAKGLHPAEVAELQTIIEERDEETQPGQPFFAEDVH